MQVIEPNVYLFVLCELCIILDARRPLQISLAVSHRLNRVFRKKCVFFITHCNPTLAYVSLQENFKALSAMECTVTPIVWQIWPTSVQPIVAQCLRGRGGKIIKVLGKNHNIS